MKKQKPHSILIGFILAASTCCCVFINTVVVTPTEISVAKSELKDYEQESTTDIIMPDIELVKKVLSRTKILLSNF